MAGSQIESQSKLMFYPTQIKEIYRIISIVGRITFNHDNREVVKEQLGKEKYHELVTIALDSNLQVSNVIYDYFLEQEDYQSIKQYFTISLNFSKELTTILDPFAGEGTFLELFTQAMKSEYESENIHLIANELETNRYNTIKEKGIIDEHYNLAFEEFNKLPKNSISLLLYNPPYGDTNGIRNVKHYLELILDMGILHNTKEADKGYANGHIVMVIRKDDLLDSLPLIVKYFDVYEELIYKVNEEEYNRFKQYVIYAKLRKEPIDLNNTYWALKYQEEMQLITNNIESNPEFNMKMYEKNYRTRIDLPSIPYREMKFNMAAAKKSLELQSDLSNSNWKWIKELTEVKDFTTEIIDKPTPLKLGETANIIASGLINGEMSLNGKANHIVVGGTRSELKEESYKEKDNNGESITVTKKILYSQPYLNVLVNNNGHYEIKEIVGGETTE